MATFIQKVISFVRQIFCDEHDKVSSKRVAGMLGFSCVCVCYVICSIKNTQLPTATTEIIIASTTLMGIDSAIKPFKKSSSKKSD